MAQRKYLLFIDVIPPENTLLDYFAKFGFDLKHVFNTQELSPALISHAEALLINCCFLTQEKNTADRFLSDIYQQFHIPLIVISEKPDENLCVELLEAGADDFLIKPIHPREMHARISAIHRRLNKSSKETDMGKNILFFSNWRLHPNSRQVFDANHQELYLSAGEYDLLLAFVRQPQCILKRDYLMQVITVDSSSACTDRRIDVQVSRLRQKLEVDARHPKLIKTIRKGGYLFTAGVSMQDLHNTEFPPSHNE